MSDTVVWIAEHVRVPLVVTCYSLRGYDAIQLASALTVHETEISVELWRTDGVRLEAASAEGLIAEVTRTLNEQVT